MAEATVSSAARVPDGTPGWSSKKPPSWAVHVTRIRPFPRPIPYKFPGKGAHPVLGFHRYSLTGGFVEMSESGFEDVLGWSHAAGGPEKEPRRERSTAVSGAPASPAPHGPVAKEPPRGGFEKRTAGQHAVAQGRRRAALWTVAEMGASAFNLKGIESLARGKAREAEKTWLAGGRAEERVGAELEKLAWHGFYTFHDVRLSGLGNVDHVVLGGSGFFCVETKSHKGRVTAERGVLLVNGRPPERDFVKQTWHGCYRLRDILGADVIPFLLFTDAFVQGRLLVRGCAYCRSRGWSRRSWVPRNTTTARR